MIAFKTLFLFSAGVCVCECACAPGHISGGLQRGEDRGGVPEVHKIFKMFPTLLSGVSGQAVAVAVRVENVSVRVCMCVVSKVKWLVAHRSANTQTPRPQ